MHSTFSHLAGAREWEQLDHTRHDTGLQMPTPRYLGGTATTCLATLVLRSTLCQQTWPQRCRLCKLQQRVTTQQGKAAVHQHKWLAWSSVTRAGGSFMSSWLNCTAVELYCRGNTNGVSEQTSAKKPWCRSRLLRGAVHDAQRHAGCVVDVTAA